MIASHGITRPPYQAFSAATKARPEMPSTNTIARQEPSFEDVKRQLDSYRSNPKGGLIEDLTHLVKGGVRKLVKFAPFVAGLSAAALTAAQTVSFGALPAVASWAVPAAFAGYLTPSAMFVAGGGGEMRIGKMSPAEWIPRAGIGLGALMGTAAVSVCPGGGHALAAGIGLTALAGLTTGAVVGKVKRAIKQ